MQKTILKIAVLLGLLSSHAFGQAKDQPNILFILVDDWGWTDLSSAGSKYYETPNIDLLRKEGLCAQPCFAHDGQVHAAPRYLHRR